uniref:Uncharacterized protein n=1 Tax=Eutreptiella gymnastica TaxID=73025 RepID=A0A7S4GGE3_9EUGL|mmetsp:Transcript_24063/g.38158  ORF Transcript_24063/g.38158 Transcript_24063/m.38158 type:complete len:122 (-) Transcript_24063:354-719(-)
MRRGFEPNEEPLEMRPPAVPHLLYQASGAAGLPEVLDPPHHQANCRQQPSGGQQRRVAKHRPLSVSRQLPLVFVVSRLAANRCRWAANLETTKTGRSCALVWATLSAVTVQDWDSSGVYGG